MKATTTSFKNSIKRTSLLLVLFFTLNTFGQNTYTFTNAGATGNNGPTQSQINTAYLNTNLSGAVISNNGIQTWTVPVTGPYTIKANGAQGGGNGGLGAQIEGQFYLTAGQVLKIVVGQQGVNGTGATLANGGGGGGGSFVITATNSLLIAAGGGGGGLAGAIGGCGLTTYSGGATYYNGNGDNGNGGYSGITNGDAAGGGGFLTNGQNSSNPAQSPCEGGKSFLNGATGGYSGNNGAYYGGAGGFGGGGSGWHNSINRCGGGGGYSGGQGGTLNTSPSGPAGGGGSFNGGNNQQNFAGINAGNGSVIISFLYGVSITQTSTITCNGFSTAALSGSVSGGSAPYTYTWLPCGGNTSTASNLAAGVYTLMVKDNADLLTSATYTVTQPLPLNITANQGSVCSGSSFTIIPQGALSYSYSCNTPVVTPTVTSSYTVTGFSNLGCPSKAIVTITVNALPSLSLTASHNQMCTNGTQVVLWGLPVGGNYSGNNVSGNFFIPTTNGTFVSTYHYTDANTSCSNTASVAIVVGACTGVVDITNKATEIKLYPNPTSGFIAIETFTTGKKEISVMDVTGRIIFTQEALDENIKLDLSGFATGVYYVTTQIANATSVVKVIKQ